MFVFRKFSHLVVLYMLSGLLFVPANSAEFPVNNIEIENYFKSTKVLKNLEIAEDQLVLIQVWSPFCPPCGEEVEILNGFLKSQTTKKVVVVGVPYWAKSREINTFVAHFKPTYKQWRPDESFINLIKRSKITPWTMLISGKKKVLWQKFNKLTYLDLENKIKPYL